MKSQWVYSHSVPVTRLPWFRANEVVVYVRYGHPWQNHEVNIRALCDRIKHDIENTIAALKRLGDVMSGVLKK